MSRVFLTDTDPKHRYFYVSAIDGPRHFLMAGPYGSREVAEGLVSEVRDYCTEKDGRAWFMAWGVAGSSDEVASRLGPVLVKATLPV